MDTKGTSSAATKSPGAVKVVGWLAILTVPIMIVRAGGLLLQGQLAGMPPSALRDPSNWKLLPTLDTLLIVTVALTPVISLIAGIGILRRRRWAWVVLVAMLAIGLTLNLVRYFYTAPEYGIMLLYGAVALALNQGEVRRAFHVGRSIDEPVE